METLSFTYLDCSATTPVAPAVLDAMLPHFRAGFGNPSSPYGLGREARAAVEGARVTVAVFLGCEPSEVVFTSGGTESNDLAIRGNLAARLAAGRPAHVITTAIEHPSVLAPVRAMVDRHGCSCTIVGVDGQGRVDVEAVLDAVGPDTALVSVMLANNEVGTLAPVAEMGRRLRDRGTAFHTDAVQAAPWLDLDVANLMVDLLSLSAHKLHGPKGVGALYVRRGTPLAPVLVGGSQEGGLRAGTENVAGIVGLAAALRFVEQRREAEVARVKALRDRMVAGLAGIEGVSLTGDPVIRLPNLASFCVAGVRADALLLGLDRLGICASSGSACSSGRLQASHVLTAMGVDSGLANGALRLSLGRLSRDEDVSRVLAVLPPLVERLRATGAT